MAIFGFGKDKEEKKPEVEKSTPIKSEKAKTETKKTPKTEKSAINNSFATDYTNVLISPRITEKSTILAEEGNVYTFDVHPNATKKEIAKAVESNYKVKPFKVNVSEIKRKKVMSRGKVGMKAGGKKAMVYLKEGDKIEFV